MNWIEIDKFIYSLIKVAKSRKTLIKDVRSRYNWTESQAEAAVAPLLKRYEKKWGKDSVPVEEVEKGTKAKKPQKRQTKRKG